MVKAYEGALVLADICLLLVRILFRTLEGIYRMIVPPEEKSVAGEIVLITGAGHGIGRELALKYASLGAIVVCWDRDSRGNRETIEEMKEAGATAVHAYECDVACRDRVFETAKMVKDQVGDVTILINNAGIMPCRSFLDTTPEDIERIFEINVLSHFWMLRAFLPSMMAKNHGHVVALSSIAGIMGLVNIVPYCASKFAVRGLMESLREELRMTHTKHGQTSDIQFTTIYPYMVDTGLCKKPRIRFPSIMSLVTPSQAAEEIVTAQRRNYTEASIPGYWLGVNAVLRTLPERACLAIIDFLDSGLDVDS